MDLLGKYLASGVISYFNNSTLLRVDSYWLLNVTKDCKSYGCDIHFMEEGVVASIYDGIFSQRDGKIYYSSNWKYADVPTDRVKSTVDAQWIPSENYVLETSNSEDYPLLKRICILQFSRIGISLKDWGEFAIKNFTSETNVFDEFVKLEDQLKDKFVVELINTIYEKTN
jgi:hypothetical protein